jgi:hypothetical protein
MAMTEMQAAALIDLAQHFDTPMTVGSAFRKA